MAYRGTDNPARHRCDDNDTLAITIRMLCFAAAPYFYLAPTIIRNVDFGGLEHKYRAGPRVELADGVFVHQVHLLGRSRKATILDLQLSRRRARQRRVRVVGLRFGPAVDTAGSRSRELGDAVVIVRVGGLNQGGASAEMNQLTDRQPRVRTGAR